ncbi:MAG: hypothetical protein C0471_03510, partial [Erythrobacter sp.]|nr:hypothetical protein [Erythrobacter sp.]
YVEFIYDWPGFDAHDTIPSNICLEGKAPTIEQVTAYFDNTDCVHPVAAGSSNVYGSNSLFRGRLYIGQEHARRLEEQLRNRDQRGIVTIRQRDDGSFTPIRIRFRPLTPAEVNFRNASEGRPFVPLPPNIVAPSGNPPPSLQSAP